MCGILGYFSTQNFDLQPLLSDLYHRGPDDSGYYIAQIGDKHLCLGHTRLSIIDLSANGHQPMQAASGKITLVFNGEIYNFQELREAFLKDYQFRSSTDTEVLLYLYERLGLDFLSKINGDFALAVLDERIGKLYLCRDHSGVKPLYYLDTPAIFAFASEIKPLLRLVPKQELDQTSLGRYFVFKYVPGADTLYKNIKRLQPAHLLEYDLNSNQHTIRPYWQLEKKLVKPAFTYRQAKETLYDLVREAAQMQLVADVPVGMFLSGGLDSSTLAFFIRNHKQLRHYCARKSAPDLKKEGSSSDYYYAHKLAQDWGLDLLPIDIGTLQATRDVISQTIRYSDDLIADGSQIPSFLITQDAARTSRVLLSGMGADELFYGYAGHQLSLMASWLDQLPGPVSASIASLLASLRPGRGLFKPYKRFLQKLGKYYRQGNLRYGFFNMVGDFASSVSVFNGADESSIDFFSRYFSEFEDVFTAISRFEFDNFLVKNLHYLDRMCMAHSVEGRVPFLDYRLVEFAFNLPREYKLSKFGRTKRILKDTMAPFLPDYILSRRKAGFGMPLRSIFSNTKHVYDLLDLDFFASLSGFSIENIQGIVSNHVSGLEDNSALIYALISFEIWYKMNISS